MVEAALKNELRLYEAAIQRTDERLEEFETKYGYSTEEFIQRFRNDEFPETMEFFEWIGEYRMRKRLEQKAEAFREIQIVD